MRLEEYRGLNGTRENLSEDLNMSLDERSNTERELIRTELDNLDKYISEQYSMTSLHQVTPEIEAWIKNIFDRLINHLNTINDVIERKTFLSEVLEAQSMLSRMRSPKDSGEPMQLKQSVQENFRRLLEETKEKNYLLYLQYNAMQEDGNYFRMDAYNKFAPMKIASGVYIANTDSGIRISLPKDREYMDRLAANVESSKNHISSFLNAHASWGGAGSIEDLRSNDLFQKENRLYEEKMEEIKGYFNTKAVPLEEIIKHLPVVEDNQIKADLKAFSTLTHPVVWEELNNLFSFDNLERPEDVFYFLRFANVASKQEIEQAQKYTEQYGDRFIRLFLSAHNDPSLAKTIIKMAENMPSEYFEKVLDTYDSIITVVTNASSFAEKEFGADVTTEAIERLRVKMFRKAGELLRKHENIIDNEGVVDKQFNELYKQMTTSSAELESYFLLLKEMYREKPQQVSFEDFMTLETTFVSVDRMKPEDRNNIADMYLRDREALHMKDEYVEKFAERIRRGDPELSCFYVARNDKILGFLCSEKYFKDDNGLLLSALTITDEGKRSPFARKFLEFVLTKQFTSEELYGYVDDDNRVARNLYTKFGFEERTGEYEPDPGVITVHRPPLSY